MSTPGEIYRAVLEGAEYQNVENISMLSIEEARAIGKETAFRTKNLIIELETSKFIKQTLVEAIEALLYEPMSERAVDKAKKALTLAKKGN